MLRAVYAVPQDTQCDTFSSWPLAESWARIADRRARLLAAIGLVAVQVWSVWSIGPHYLSYFNASAGGPERGYTRLADSNVDWGQDLPALRTELTRLGARHPVLSYFGTAPLDAYAIFADVWDESATNVDGVFL